MKAIRAFSADQKEIKDGNTILSGAVASSLTREDAALHHVAYRARVKVTQDHVRLDQLTAQQRQQRDHPAGDGVAGGDEDQRAPAEIRVNPLVIEAYLGRGAASGLAEGEVNGAA